MTIGIDIDDTMTNTKEKASYYLKKYDVEKKYTNYHELDRDDFEDFLYKYIDLVQAEATLKPGVVKTINYLHDRGHKIVIITVRGNKYSQNIIDITKKYLEKSGIYYDKIIFESKNKGIDAKKLGVSLFIDDKEENLDNLRDCNIKVLKYDEDKKESKYNIASSWDEVKEYLIKEGF